MFNLLRKLEGSLVPSVTLMGDELQIALKALERSSEAMPDETETVLSRNSRANREAKLATRIRNAY